MKTYTTRQVRHWKKIERISRYDYAVAMRLAANFGRLLAEKNMQQEREEITVQRVAQKAVAA